MLPLHCAASKAGGQADHKSKPSRKFDEVRISHKISFIILF